MSPAEKRVEIAKDLIARIQLEQISALGSNGIVSFQYTDFASDSIKSLLENVETTVCKVCAKGGLLMSYIGRVNEMSRQDLISHEGQNSNYCFDPESLHHQKLKEVFDVEQLVLIEEAFEGRTVLGDGTFNFVVKNEKRYDAYSYKEQYEDANERLIAIAENIIKNEGTFIP